jgi:RNA polymerase sigma-70 factor, ECF subfamily
VPNRKDKIQKAVAWSDTAFREVYSRYIRPVYSFILRRVRNHHDAEDLTSQVFTQVLHHLDPKNPGSPQLEAWLFTSARNATANHARARNYVATLAIEEIDEKVAEQVAEEEPDRRVEEKDDLERLLQAIERLPEEKRKALTMRFFEELSHAEIAEALGRTENSARVLLHRTVAGLREEVS